MLDRVGDDKGRHLPAQLVDPSHRAGQCEGGEHEANREERDGDPERDHAAAPLGTIRRLASASFTVRRRRSAPRPVPSTT